MTCDRCGRANRDGARFCDACGAPLGAGASSPESDDVRKVVTIVFADLAGSTPLQERLDPESSRQLMDRYYAVMRAAVDDHHGTVVKLLGDGVMAVFGVPHVAEDDALRAVRAGHEMQARFSEMLEARPALGGDFDLRVGINTGEVVVMAADDDVVGDPVNVAARLQAHAGLGQILVGEPTRRLVDGLVTLEPAGDLQLKGRAELVAAYRLVSLDPPVTRAATRLVGRGPELEQLERSLDAAVAGGASLAMVLGSPGLGKTRLLDEFGRVVGDRVTLLTGHCDAAGLATFAPIAEALRGVTGLGDAVPADAIRRAIAALVPDDEPERDRIVERAGGLLGAGAPASPEETFWAVRRLLAGLARSRPVVLVLDDLHWAEPPLLDLVEHVVEWSTDVPLLVVGAARPELREVRSSLMSPGGRADVVVLDALDAGAATRLAADVLGTDELPAAVAGRVLAASEGNPLFVRELVRMLVDDGVLHRDGERWQATAELAAIEMPPTIHALLASRLERLRPEQRAVIERAAVIGRQFTFAALDHLLAPEVARALDDHLDALRRSELVEADDSWFVGEPVLRFHHALIRDAAYRRLLKGTRAELHERYADWLGDRLDAGTPDRDDTIGWHLEQAHASLMELGQDDEHVRELGRRAAEHLERAGRQALERDDLTVAANLLGRALDRFDADDPGRADLQLERCEALLAAGEVTIARRAVDALATNAPGDARLAAWHTAFVAQLAILTEPERLPELVESIAPVAEAMRAVGDVSGEAKAHYVHALALSRLGRVGAAETALDRALAAARAAGDRRLANAVLSSAPLAALWGPSPVTRASGRCLDVVRVLRITAGAPAVEAVALRCQAVLEALRGRVDAARRMIGSARRTLEELGLTHRLLETEVFAGLVELYDDDPGAAEARLRPAFEQLRARGLGGEAAQAAALLGRTLLLQGRDVEADALGHDAEALAGADLKAAIAWRGVQAEAASRRGETATALGLARAAVELAAGTDALLDHADARLVLAAVLRAVGDDEAATAEARRAADLYEAKGATVLAERAAPAARPAAATRPRPADAQRLKPTGIEENTASATMRRSGVALSARDWEAYTDCFALTCRIIDQQGFTRVDLAVDEFLSSFRTVMDFAEVRATNEILATRGDHLAVSRQYLWGRSPEGGESDFEILSVAQTDEAGRAVRILWLQPDDLEGAQAVLRRWAAELAPPKPRPIVSDATFANAATRLEQRFVQAWAARDWEAVVATYADGYRWTDRRAITRIDLDRDDTIVTMRQVFDMTESEWLPTLAATRGERLALYHHWVRFVGRGAGDSEVEILTVVEVDDAGDAIGRVIFDANEMDAAYDELDARFVAGEGAALAAALERNRQFMAAYGARDWSTVRDLISPSSIFHDHRLMGFGVFDRDAYLEWLAAIPELSADATIRTRHVLAFDARRGLGVLCAEGGGDEHFDIPFALVTATDDAGLTTSMDFYDLEQLDEARARYRSLDDGHSFENDASRVAARVFDACRHGPDPAGFFAEGFRLADRRQFGGTDLTSDDFVEGVRAILTEGRWTTAREVVATRGERLALVRMRWSGEVAPSGESELQYLALNELDDDGRLRETVLFETGDLEAAYDELDARYAAAERGLADMIRGNRWFREAYARRDWDAAAGLLAADAEFEDHRPLGWGTLDRDGYLATLRTLTELADDAVLRMAHLVEADPPRTLGVWEVTGAPGFEILFVLVSAADEIGRPKRMDFYDLDQLEEARARYRDLSQPKENGRSGAIASSFENAAVRNNRRYIDAYLMREWDTAVGCLAPGFRRFDRRPLVGLEQDYAKSLESMRLVFDMEMSAWTSEQVATRGERLALFRQRIAFAGAGVAESQLEWLVVLEVDERESAVAAAMFDVEDLDAAYEELDDRFEGMLPGPLAGRWRNTRRALETYAAGNIDRLVDALASDFVLDDHRASGWGRLDRQGWRRHVEELVELAQDARMRFRDVLEFRERATMTVNVTTGEIDGGPFEITRITVEEYRPDGRLQQWDFYDVDDLDAARTRFAEIEARGGERTSRVRPNAASRAFDATSALFNTREVERYRERCAPGVVFADRQHHLELGIDAWIADARFVTEGVPDVRMSTDLVATAGDRLAVVRAHFAGSVVGGGPFATEFLQLIEVDPSGLLTAVLKYEPDDRVEAFGEMLRRFAEDEAAAHPESTRLLRDLSHAVLTTDWTAWRATLADDFSLHDRRTAGIGTITAPDDWVEAQRVMAELSLDVALTATEVLAIADHGWIVRVRVVGTLAEGGPFESDHLDLFTIAGGRISGVELFDPDDVAAAQARFEELRPDPQAIPPNAATHAERRRAAAFETRNWEGWLATVAESMTFDDRRSLVRTMFDREQFFASTQHIARGNARFDSQTLATAGDRLALDHVHWTIDETLGHEVEMDLLTLHEVGLDGRTVAFLNFDMVDRVDAFAEMERRFIAGEAGVYAAGQQPIVAFDEAFAQRNWAALRAVLADDFVATDHRLAWMGSSNVDEYVASMRTFAELSPDVASETMWILAWGENGHVAMTRVSGNQRDGGPFENMFVSMYVTVAGKISSLEVWEAEDADEAVAQFEGLRPRS